MGWEHFRDGRPTARKRHRCFLCCGPIEPGETYVRRSGKNDGGPMSFAMHAECEAETKLWDEWDWEHFSTGNLPRPGSDRAARASGAGRLIDEQEMAFTGEGEDWD